MATDDCIHGCVHERLTVHSHIRTAAMHSGGVWRIRLIGCFFSGHDDTNCCWNIRAKPSTNYALWKIHQFGVVAAKFKNIGSSLHLCICVADSSDVQKISIHLFIYLAQSCSEAASTSLTSSQDSSRIWKPTQKGNVVVRQIIPYISSEVCFWRFWRFLCVPEKKN